MALVGRGMDVYYQRRANPGDDLGSVIANAAVDGEEMTVGAFAAFFMLLVDAGGIEALMARPEQFSWLLADIEGRPPTATRGCLNGLLNLT